jgi:hypothetical protein
MRVDHGGRPTLLRPRWAPCPHQNAHKRCRWLCSEKRHCTDRSGPPRCQELPHLHDRQLQRQREIAKVCPNFPLTVAAWPNQRERLGRTTDAGLTSRAPLGLQNALLTQRGFVRGRPAHGQKWGRPLGLIGSCGPGRRSVAPQFSRRKGILPPVGLVASTTPPDGTRASAT